MKHLKVGLRVWIAISSVVGFLGGWALLAHAQKPVPFSQQPALVELAPLPNLAPLPAFRSRNLDFQPLPVFPQTRMSSSRLLTGGS